MDKDFIEALLMVIRERELDPKDFNIVDVYEMYQVGNTPITIVEKTQYINKIRNKS